MSGITYIRPSGTEITVGDTEANRAHAEANGWKEKAKTAPKAKPKAKAAPRKKGGE